MLDHVFDSMIFKSIVSGAMFGVSYFMQYVTIALILFLGAVYASSTDLGIDGPLTSIFLIFFACVSAGNKANLMQDFVTVN